MTEDDKPCVMPLKGDGPLAALLLREMREYGYDKDVPWRDELVEARYEDWKGGKGR